jgi:hypothetical protein
MSSKKRPICFFCKKEVDIHNEPYYVIEGPNGEELKVHEHVGVAEHGGMMMFRGKPVVKEEENETNDS